MRSEDQAIADLVDLGELEVARYGTKSTDHHQSSKVLVATVAAITRLTCRGLSIEADLDPQARTAIQRGGTLWVSPRRLDGALPSLMNPVGMWEIKEYWGLTKGGSKMSDAIYEINLVGMELRAFERLHGIPRTRHYAMLEGQFQWSHRASDLRRAIDLLCMDLVDELFSGC